MAARHTNIALLPRSSVRTWSPGAQTAHCSLAPRSEHGRQALKHRIVPSLHGQSMVTQAHKHRIASLLHGQSMVARHSNSASLPCSTVRHGSQVHKHRIAPPLLGQVWFPGAQTKQAAQACARAALQTGMAVRHSNSALPPRSKDRTWSPGAQTAHCSPAPRTEHGHQLPPLLHSFLSPSSLFPSSEGKSMSSKERARGSS